MSSRALMGELPMARDYLGVHRLDALVAAGHGDVPLVSLPLRCRQTGHKIIVSGKS